MLSAHNDSFSDQTDIETPRPHVLVISLDFDGCVFNMDYMYHPENNNRLLEYNKRLIDFIVSQLKNEKYDKVIFFVGSNRQSYKTDQANIRLPYKGSCYPEMQKLVKEIESRSGVPCTLDTYLLADSYGKRAHGNTFAKCLAGDKDGYADFVWDQFKYSILYAQSHKIASENPEADVVFQFVDDKYEDILPNLVHFYSKQFDLLPRNLCRLKLFHYDEEHLRQFNVDDNNQEIVIRGNGPIDYFYDDNLNIMAKCRDNNSNIATANFVDDISTAFTTSEAIHTFKRNRIIRADEMNIEITNVINALLANPNPNISQEDLLLFCESARALQNILCGKLNQEIRMNADSNSYKIARDFLRMAYDLLVLQPTTANNNHMQSFVRLYNPKTATEKFISLARTSHPHITHHYSHSGLTLYQRLGNTIELRSKLQDLAQHLETILNKVANNSHISQRDIGRRASHLY